MSALERGLFIQGRWGDRGKGLVNLDLRHPCKSGCSGLCWESGAETGGWLLGLGGLEPN